MKYKSKEILLLRNARLTDTAQNNKETIKVHYYHREYCEKANWQLR